MNKSKSKGGEAYVALRPIRPLFISGSVNYDDARVVSGPPGTVVGANVQRELVRGLTGFVSVENIGDKQYQINLSGTGANTLISYGLPRTVRIGLQAYRY